MDRGERYFLSVIAGIAVWVGSNLALSDRMQIGCEDGWRSSSIGRQGACSHHGGVRYEDPTPIWKKFAFFGAGLAVALLPVIPDMRERRRAKLRGPMPAFFGLEDDKSRILQGALDSKNPVRFLYQREDGQVMRRSVMPKELMYLHGMSMEKRCLVGHCYLRGAERKFMLSRMSSLELIDVEALLAKKRNG